MIFSARTLPVAGPVVAGAVAARRVAAWAVVWPVIAALAAPAARRGRRVFFFFSEIICRKGQRALLLELRFPTSSRDLSRTIADAIRIFFRVS